MQFDIRNRYTGAVQFTAEIDCAEDAPASVKIGSAVIWAAMTGANLRRADLSGADLSGADLRGAVLRGASLSGANLSGADLSVTDLSVTDLREAYLRGADLSGADLRGADLRGAYLRDADLSGANLSGAYLRGAKDIPAFANAQTVIVPEGQIVGWKKCRDNVIVKLIIPAEARRSNATGRKCRAEYADVAEVIGAEAGISRHDGMTEYRVGQRVTCDKWCEDRWEECAGGIHFFITRDEAEAYWER